VRADDGIELAPSAQPGENRAAGAFVWTLCSPAAPGTTADVGGAPVATVSIAGVMQRRSGGEVAPLMVDNLGVSTADLHEEEVESRYEATFAVGLVIGLQLTLALVSLGGGWKLIGLPGWVWLIPAVPEAGLLLALAWSAPRHRLEQMGRRRTVALALVGVIALANVLALLALIASLLSAQEKSGGELLLKGATIWSTNVITFGLLFWEFDRGGPIRRLGSDARPRDFQFPQDENPALAEPDWYPRLADYVYVSFTNAIAFSPTDAMPLTRRVKMMMLAESAISATTVLLVAARAVNILR
jgi:uncharacterized membrane protein